MNYVVDSLEFEAHWSNMLFNVSVISSTLLLYALYVVLFLFSIHTLRRQIPAGKILRVAAWAMFLLASASTIVACLAAGTSMHVVHTVVEGSPDAPTPVLRHYHALRLGQDIILAMNKSVHPSLSLIYPDETKKSLVTDLLFLYRCFVIWGARRGILVLPGMFIFATVAVSMAGVTNTLLMFLTAGRIWYIRRESKALSCQSFQKRYATAIAIVLESGVLYSLCVIIYVISTSIKTESASETIFNGVAWSMVQIGVNIAPTLILVRVGMGRSTENTPPPTLGSSYKV
ncbi:hypothetical protein C8F04DRAFT_1394271 [Mycena alexandri]|uniref:Uncharacterized protein n=1 Tax=Mycena alexandri TaxID=1745969 RepID=A0AAD6SZ96_9AGAR|nr:hypothetical protein C8F04DRAFT_1394271 [Mycena alexandri]